MVTFGKLVKALKGKKEVVSKSISQEMVGDAPPRGVPLTSLKEFLERTRGELSKDFLDAEMIKTLEGNNVEDLLFLATSYIQLGLHPTKMPRPSRFIIASNLFFMREAISEKENLTFGADPEFILRDRRDPDRTVLLSSKHRLPYNDDSGKFSLSELAVGADYGLLEFRPAYTNDFLQLVKSVSKMLKAFEKVQAETLAEITGYEEEHDEDDVLACKEALSIQEVEAVEFSHKKQRLLEIMEDRDLDFGLGTRHKVHYVVPAGDSASDIGIVSSLTFGMTLSAYDEPTFTQGNDHVLTAGGHIHLGGRRIRMFNLGQLKELVKEFDRILLPEAAKVETPAAKLRQQYYGAPGEFRLKEYGIEYRSLSNAIFLEKNHKVLTNVLSKASSIVLNFHKEKPK